MPGVPIWWQHPGGTEMGHRSQKWLPLLGPPLSRRWGWFLPTLPPVSSLPNSPLAEIQSVNIVTHPLCAGYWEWIYSWAVPVWCLAGVGVMRLNQNKHEGCWKGQVSHPRGIKKAELEFGSSSSGPAPFPLCHSSLHPSGASLYF